MNKFMISKFKSTCHETGNVISKGEHILYDTASRKAYCSKSQKYKAEIGNVSKPQPTYRHRKMPILTTYATNTEYKSQSIRKKHYENNLFAKTR